LVLALALLGVDTGRAQAVERTPWRVYPLIFYGNNQSYKSDWGSNTLQRMEQVRAWYKEQVGGETFEIGTLITMQGQRSWQWYDVNEWDRIYNEVRARGEPLWETGYIYMVFIPWGGFAGGAADGYNKGYAMLGNFALQAYERPDDCVSGDFWPSYECGVWCAQTAQTGAMAHELGHALNLDADTSCQTGLRCLRTYQYFPIIRLLDHQKSNLRNYSGFINPPAGTVPNAPSNVGIATATLGRLKGTWTDNSTNEQYFYHQLEQWNGGSAGGECTVCSSLYRFGPYSGTGSRTAYSYAWYSYYDGATSFYHIRAWAQGSAGNSGKAESSPYWVQQTRPTPPNAVTDPVTLGDDDGYDGVWVCWWDQATNETGFLVKQWRKVDGLPGRLEFYHVRESNTATPPAWTCHWTDVPANGYYRYDIFDFRKGASSTKVATGWEYGVPTGTQ
jgi:hypothetical protein